MTQAALPLRTTPISSGAGTGNGALAPWGWSAPLARDVGVIGLVPDRWTDLWQPRHQVMRRLGAFFNVAWADPTPFLGEPGLLRWGSDVEAPVPPGLLVYRAPGYLPRFRRPRRLAHAVLRARIGQIRQRLAERGARRFVLYLWRPQFAWALEAPHDLSVYHIDDEYSFDPSRIEVTPAEAKLIERAGEVIIHSPRLMELKGGINPRTTEVPNGVDYLAFATPRPEPAELAVIPRPLVGYAGWIKPQLDWDLLDQVAARCPDLSFVFVGATSSADRLATLASYRRLRERPNVHFIGAKSPTEIAAYPQHFDVGMMPYRVDPYTDCIYPLKLHETLASGRPVVATPIRSLEAFAEQVALAADAEGWTAALRRALGAEVQNGAARRGRRATARAYDWWGLTARIASRIAGALDHPAASRIERAGHGYLPDEPA